MKLNQTDIIIGQQFIVFLVGSLQKLNIISQSLSEIIVNATATFAGHFSSKAESAFPPSVASPVVDNNTPGFENNAP